MGLHVNMAKCELFSMKGPQCTNLGLHALIKDIAYLSESDSGKHCNRDTHAGVMPVKTSITSCNHCNHGDIQYLNH